MNNPDVFTEQQYDRLDDQGMYDAATIREKTGYETDGSNEDFTYEAIAARVGTVVLNNLEDESQIPPFDGINQKGGLNHVAYRNQSPEQKAITARGIAEARRIRGN